MKRTGLLLGLCLAILLAVVPQEVCAFQTHYFNCNVCHKPSLSTSEMGQGNVCLSCHEYTAGGSASFNNAYRSINPPTELTPITNGLFIEGNASSIYGNNPNYAPQIKVGTSHNWAATDTNIAAGSSAPSIVNYPELYPSSGASAGKVTCSRCHNPHAEYNVNNPYLFYTDTVTSQPMTPEKLCLACHTTYDQPGGGHGKISHPLVANYAAWRAVDDSATHFSGVPRAQRYYDAAYIANAPGEIALVNGAITCTTCHKMHNADSDATTPDTTALAAIPSGDGRLLRADGTLYTTNTATDAGGRPRATGFCSTCHTPYEGAHPGIHGASSGSTDAGTAMGCLGCHSGHNVDDSIIYNQTGQSYFLLKANYTQLPQEITNNPADPTRDEVWGGTTVGHADGFCEACHGDVADPAAPINNSRVHVPDENCDACHAGNTDQPTGCDTCHGSPPRTDTPGSASPGNTGYAFVSNAYNYTLAASYTDESLTPHAEHAFNGTGDYAYACDQCHKGNTHNSGNTYQDLFIDKSGIIANIGMTPTYSGGSCSTVYCHSNGGKRTGDGTRTYTAATIPAWANGSGAGQINTCDVCHDNSGAMARNSASHAAHLARGYTCDYCHKDTAASNTTLATGANGGKHVDGNHDVNFKTSFPILTGAAYPDPTAGTCAVYCHSNGTTLASADWDVAANGDCGACHKVDADADTIQDGTGPSLVGAHNTHVFDADGPNLACTVCHSNNGSGIEHVNYAPSMVSNYQQNVCNPCHGSANGITTGDDRQPIWTSAASVDCKTCHAGSVVATDAPAKSLATSTGHGKTTGVYNVSNNSAANQACTACHNANVPDHHDAIGNDLLIGGFDCANCHGTIVTHQSQACTACHDPHGTTNIFMVNSTSSGNYSGTVAFSALTSTNSYDESDVGGTDNQDDICATCHTYNSGNTTAHNNKTNEGLRHNEGTNCFTSCHLPHTNVTGAFAAGGGDSCDSCHGYPPTGQPQDGAHAVHAPTSATLDSSGKVYRDGTNGYADVTACEHCHDGAALYTYNQAGDATSGTPGRQNHGAGNPNQVQVINTTVGYTGTTCSNACHVGNAGVAATWSDTSLGCDACHYHATGASLTSANNSASANELTGRHGKHFDISATVACEDCHTLPEAGNTAHINDRSGADELAKVMGMATATSYEAAITNTALGANGVDPAANGSNASCNNVACHNPVNDGYIANWGAAGSASCTLCHGDQNSAWAADPGSHLAHLAAHTQFGKSVTCANCHDPLPVSNAHRDGIVNLRSAHNYTAGAQNVLGTFGSCTTSTCHNDGTVAATPVPTPNWDEGASGDHCAVCHALTPTTGEHTAHLASTNYVTGNCATCHPAATASSHIDNTRTVANQVSNYTSGNGTCANSCHIADTAGDWTTGSTALACADCHAAGSGKSLWTASGSGTWPPSSNKHSQHLGSNALSQTSPNDCFICHDDTVDNAGALKASGAHLDLNAGNLQFTNGYGYQGGMTGFVGNDAATTCSNILCHMGNTTPSWNSSITCGDCHGASPSNAAPTDNAARSHAAHAGSNADCANCHAGAGSYTVAGGAATHQNLIVNLGAAGVTYSDGDGSAGLVHSGDFTDDGTCSAAACHGASTPQWGVPGSVGCGTCHTIPPTSGSHLAHADSDTDYSECIACHGDNGDQYASGDGTHSDETVNFVANVTYSGGTTGTCTTAICHSAGANTTTWGTPASLGCDECHYHDLTPTAAENTANANAISNDHGNHFDAGYGCTDCHAAVADQTHITDVSGANDGAVLTGKAKALQDEAAVNVITWNDGNDSCANAACHDPSGLGYNAVWLTETASCVLCHGDTVTKPTSGSHAEHLNAATGFGINTIACASCHGTLPVSTAHRNAIVNFAAGMSYTVNAADVGGNVGTCTTTTCHSDGKATPAAVPTPTWGVASDNCTICHGNAPATGEHAKHFANTTYVDGGCADCHTAETVTTHIDGSRNLASQISNYTTGDGTCANNCHIANTSGDWTNGTNTLACADCHGSGKNTTPAMDRGWPPAQGAHGVHFVNNAYVTGANCTDCHNDNTTTHSALNNALPPATGAKISLNPGNGSCTNSCHAAAQASDWTGGSAAITCTDCHSGTYIGGNNVAKGFNATPASGLHAVTPSVSGQRHDQTVSGGCDSCHITVMAQGTHIAGTFTGDGSQSGDRTAMGLAAFYTTSGSDNTGTCATTACHLGNSDDWQHQWNSTANYYTTSPSACAGCHGSALASANLGTSGVTHLAVDAKHNTGTYFGTYGCRDCHNLEAATGYIFTFGSNDWKATGGTSTHGDSNIQVNSNGSYNATTGYCNACHSSGAVNFSDTGWTIVNAAGDSLSSACGECHEAGVTRTGQSGAHAAHNATSADLTTAGGSGADCAPCHGSAAASYTSNIGGAHGDDSVTFVDVDYSTVIRNDVTGTCLTGSCHNVSSKTERSNAWNAAQLECDDCHYYASDTTPTAANNTAHGRALTGSHGAHFATGGSFACADCHGTDPANGTTTHIDGVATLADKAVAGGDEASITVNTWNDTDNTCANAACHNPSGASYIANWGVSTSSCTLCHGDMTTQPASGSHDEHLGASASYGIDITCTSCHPNHTGNNRHRNGSVTFTTSPAALGYTVNAQDVGGSVGTCSTATCHNDGTVAANPVLTPTWGNASATACGTCHVATPTTNKHTKHLNNSAYVGNNCAACHTDETTSAHINTLINTTVAYSAGNCTNTCHTLTGDGSGAAGWLTANPKPLGCADCHSGSYIGGNNVAKGFNATPASGLHAIVNALAHDASFQYGGSPTYACISCHDSTPSSAHVTGTLQNAAQTTYSFNSYISNYDRAVGCAAQCHDDNDATAGNSGKWMRKWLGVTDARPNVSSLPGDAVCDNCHGDGLTAGTQSVDNLWNGGLIPAHNANVDGNNGIEMIGQHGLCQTCHGYGSAGYNATWGANHGDGLLSMNGPMGTGSGYDDGTVLNTASNFGCTAACHSGSLTNSGDANYNHKLADSGWIVNYGNFGSGDCNTCHNDELNNAHTGSNESNLTHTLHTSSDYIAGDCSECHPHNGISVSPGTGVHFNGTIEFSGGNLVGNYIGNWTVGCSTNACHDSDAISEWANGSLGGDACNDCHESGKDGLFYADIVNAYPPTSNKHGLHLGSTALISNCIECHDHNGTLSTTPGANHIDTVLAVGNQLTNYTSGDGSCANTCHNLAGSAGAVTWTGSNSLGCNDCHNKAGNTIAAPVHADLSTTAGPASGQHTAHVGGDADYMGSAKCVTCHKHEGALGSFATTGHANGAVSFDTAVTNYVSGDQTCTNSCHTVVNGRDWTAGTLDCNDCHNASGKSLYVNGAVSPTSAQNTGKHNKHLLNTVYVGGCADCHGHSGSLAAASHVDGPTITTNVAYQVNGTCTNSCHVAADTSEWSVGTLNCTDCHSGTYIGGNNVAKGFNAIPASGLHAVVNALAHDASFQYGASPTYSCTNCHSSTPSAAHITGTLQTAAQTTYSFASYINNYNRTVGCAASCHDDNAATAGDTGKWMRKWIGVADARPGAASVPGAAVCDNCHGDGIDQADGTTIDNAWNSGLIPAHGDVDGNNGIEMIGQHGLCQTCHGYGGTSYDETWGTGNHGDTKLSMNGPVGTGSGYDDGTVVNTASNFGCTAACHAGSLTNAGAANYNHKLANSGWLINYGDFGSGDCNTCHGSQGRNHAGVTTESVYTHNMHIGSDHIAGACTECHPHDGTSVSPGTGIHGLGGTVNFGNKIANSYDYAGSDFGGNCSTNTCHDSDDAEEEWHNISLGADACQDCHNSGKTGLFTLAIVNAYPPTSNKHGLHLGNTALISNCVECHNHNGTLSSVAPYTNHIDTALTVGNQLSNYTTGDGSCANSCHNLVGSGGAVTWTGPNSLGCNDCHNKSGNTIAAPVHAGLSDTAGPASGKHAEHVDASSSYVADTCTACHKHQGALGNAAITNHADGSLTYAANLSYGSNTCTNTCHLAGANDWDVAGALGCTDCHTQASKSLGAAGEAGMSAAVAPTTGKHTKHMSSNNYVPNNCVDCHGHSGELTAGSNGHVAGPSKASIGVANEVTGFASNTCTNTCHLAGVNGWTVGTLACADCHDGGGSLDQGTWPPSSAAHAGHVNSNALGGSGNSAQNDCYACHGNTTTNAGAFTGTGHLNLTAGDVVFSSSFNYEAGLANVASGSGDTTTCANVLCHNGGTTPTWGAGTIACGDCHGTLANAAPTDNAAGRHDLHASGNADCVSCHSNAASYTAAGGHASHQNLIVNVLAGYTDGDGGAGVNYSGDHADDGTCASIACHYSTTTPAWNATASLFPARCVRCHNDGSAGTTLSNSVPSASATIHNSHVTDADADYVTDDCAACHGSGADTAAHTGHSDLATTFGNNMAVANYIYNSTNKNCTNACHLAADVNDWTASGALVCNDCHNATGKSLYVSGVVTVSVAPATGVHNAHMASTTYVTTGCAGCHGHSGSLAAVTHVDGPAVSSITVANLVSNYTAGDGTCANTCHNVSNGRDWTSATALACDDCHGANGKTLFRSRISGSHAAHYNSTPTLADYGRTGNDSSSNYNYGCGVCHPASEAVDHLDGSSREVINIVNYAGGAAGTCGTNSCHQNGKGGAPLATPTWGTPFTGDKCNKCHGNSPATNAHSAHVIGIHATDIYSGTTGLLTTATASKAHGNAATSTTINCNLCHSSVVTSSANALNSACVGCHTDSATPATGNAVATIANKQLHVNGTPQVAFAMTSFKSKAQLRDDISVVNSLNNSWSRDNGYKVANSYDQARVLNAPAWNGTTCSTVDCHNGQEATWTQSNVSCTYCHTSTPQ